MKNYILPLLGSASLLLFLNLGVHRSVAQILPPPGKTTTIDTSEFVLKGITLNGDTGENFDHIYVDIYRILEDGSLELVRADRYPGGKFAIWLRRNERYLLKMNYNDQAFLEGFLNPADAQITHDVLSQIFILDEYQPEEHAVANAGTELTAPPVIVSEAEIMDATTDTASVDPADAASPGATPEIPPVADGKEEEAEASDHPVVEEEDTPSAEDVAAPPAPDETDAPETFYVFESTSFREEATHLSGVILRFTPGDAVVLLEKTDQYWWKVRFKDKTGWVKAAKLRRDWF
jgi:hypothetical protein